MASKEPETKLVLSEQEMKVLRYTLMTRFTYTSISLAEDLELQLQDLARLAEMDPSILGTNYFGRIDN